MFFEMKFFGGLVEYVLLTLGFNEVAEGDLGEETRKVSEPLNSC